MAEENPFRFQVVALNNWESELHKKIMDSISSSFQAMIPDSAHAEPGSTLHRLVQNMDLLIRKVVDPYISDVNKLKKEHKAALEERDKAVAVLDDFRVGIGLSFTADAADKEPSILLGARLIMRRLAEINAELANHAQQRMGGRANPHNAIAGIPQQIINDMCHSTRKLIGEPISPSLFEITTGKQGQDYKFKIVFRYTDPITGKKHELVQESSLTMQTIQTLESLAR